LMSTPHCLSSSMKPTMCILLPICLHPQGTDSEACAWCGKSSFLGCLIIEVSQNIIGVSMMTCMLLYVCLCLSAGHCW
jgi:hypothetical protein